MNHSPCASCGQDTSDDGAVHFGSIEKGYRTLCNYCYNATVAESAGLKGFENARFDPMELIDQDGVPHLFYFRYRLFVTGVSLDAYESPPDGSYGYQFRVIGPPEGDPFELLGRLVSKIKRGLSTRYLEETHGRTHIASHDMVRGQIECDLDCPERLPLIIIDGREFTWDEFGQMLAGYEGWSFQLEINERGEAD